MKPENQISDWQVEFPRLYRWVHNPLAFFGDVIVGWERKLRKCIYLVGLIMIGYVVWSYFREMRLTGEVPSEVAMQWLRWRWVVGRNMLYMLIMLDGFVFLLPALVVYILRKQYAKVAKTLVSAFWMVFFVTFSFALAGLIIDLVYVGAGFIVYSLDALGAPVTLDPVQFLLGK